MPRDLSVTQAKKSRRIVGEDILLLLLGEEFGRLNAFNLLFNDGVRPHPIESYSAGADNQPPPKQLARDLTRLLGLPLED